MNLDGVLDVNDQWEIDPQTGIPKRSGTGANNVSSSENLHVQEGHVCVTGKYIFQFITNCL